MATITNIRFVGVAAKVSRAYGISKALGDRRQTTIVVVETDQGVEGIGEAWGVPAMNLAALPLLADQLVGVHVADVELAFAALLARNYHFGVQNPLMASISGIDIAAKDALGKIAGLPLCRLIGGRGAASVACYASGGYFTENADRDFAPQIERVAADGHRAAKIKIGASPASDAARAATARGILGPGVDLLVDINANYTLDLARDSLRRLAPLEIGWVEEPLSPLDFAGYAELRRTSPIPVATGEALYTAYDFKRLVEAGGADVLQPDLSLCGGLWQGRRIADIAEQAHLRLSPHVWGSGIGLAAAVHYVASRAPWPHTLHVPKPMLVEYDVGENPLREGLLREPLRPAFGRLPVPDRPGLGIEIDWAAVKRFAIG